MRSIFIDKTILKHMYTYKRHSQDEISRRLDCSQWVISNRLRYFNIKTRPKTYNLSRRKYVYNKNFLKNLSTDIGWVLGLLVSDGFIIKNNLSGYFGLSMKSDDEDVILKVKRILGYSGPVYRGIRSLEYKGRVKKFEFTRLQINGVETVNELEELGIKQNKTFDEKFLRCIKETRSEEVISSFIRGIYDGDGSILFDPKTSSPCFQIVGADHLLRDIQRYLMYYCYVARTKLTQNIAGKNHFALRYRGNRQAMRILDWIYKHSSPSNRMDRKFNKYSEIRGED